jgi:ATP-dependent helicase/nuclease subunit B
LELAEHRCEVLPELARRVPARSATADSALTPLRHLPDLGGPLRELQQLREPEEVERLSPGLADALYGPVLRTSVSRLEEFAACPFRFFVSAGLRAEERRLLELDVRQQGDFRHQVLAEFHRQIARSGRRWRDLTANEARRLIREVAAQLAPRFGQGLLLFDHHGRFTIRALTLALEDFIGTVIDWMASYEFDPVAVELGFGQAGDRLPAWEIPLGGSQRLALRGVVDRVDLISRPGLPAPWAVVIDYKSKARAVDPVLLEHGIQLQLLAYLAALRRLPSLEPVLGAPTIRPAGVFYVDLQGQYRRTETRQDALQDPAAARRLAYRHRGRFTQAALPHLDRFHGSTPSGQFHYAFTQKGEPNRRCPDLLPGADLDSLLDRVEQKLAELGRAIYAGEAQVDPYRRGTSEAACDHCPCRAVCRIDPWTHLYRMLGTPSATPASAEADRD